MAVWTSIQLSEVRSGFRIDSEFYKEEYLQKDHELFRLKRSSLGHLAKVTDGEHGSVKFVIHGIKYLTAENVKQGYIDFDGVRYVGPEVDHRNARARVSVDDVLISIKGTLGEVGVAEKQLLPANMNRDVAIIKPFASAPSGLFISAFLRSTYGKYQLAREGSGGVQQMITLERLRNIQIPQLSDGDINLVVSEYQQALSKRQESIKLYTQAQQLLEAELGLDKLRFEKPVGYTARFSELELSRRADAEFFNPKYQKVIGLVKQHSFVTFGRLFSVRRGICIDPRLYNEIDGRSYIRIKELSLDQPLAKNDSIKISEKYISGKYPHARTGDYILAVIGATIGKINLISDDLDGSLFSNNTACLSPKIEIAHPNAYELILRSPIIQYQIQQRMAKTAQEKISDPELKKILIPILSTEVLDELEHLVVASKKSYHQSKQLIDQAKSRVEQLIEKAVQK
jgi:restriction endonuclease S subunit